MTDRHVLSEPVVITGIGLIASVGNDRESVWDAVRNGRSNFRYLRGIRGIIDDTIVGATVDLHWRGPPSPYLSAIIEQAVLGNHCSHQLGRFSGNGIPNCSSM